MLAVTVMITLHRANATDAAWCKQSWRVGDTVTDAPFAKRLLTSSGELRRDDYTVPERVTA
jgi:hypothetical protein